MPGTCAVANYIHSQSPDRAQGVDESYEVQNGEAAEGDVYDTIGAGDQGVMFGYACNEPSTLMPMPIYLAHRLSERLTQVRKDGTLPLPAPRRQDPGDRALCRRQARRRRKRSSFPPSIPEEVDTSRIKGRPSSS